MNLSWLLPSIKGIPVLMYHKVWPGINDALTITPEKLREQWAWMLGEGYSPLSQQEYLSIMRSGKRSFPEKSFLITFDDGYLNNYQYVYPLLIELNWPATFFIIADSLEITASNESDYPEKKMTLLELKQLDTNVVQLGLHGYHHEDFNKLTLDEIQQVMKNSIDQFKTSGLQYQKILAYPYGARPKDAAKSQAMKTFFKQLGIEAAYRIGNQVSEVPATDIYELRRIDIKGTDTLDEFKTKLKKGKLKPF